MNQGGKREGAGRKACPDTKKLPFNCRLPRYLLAWLRAQDKSQAVLIEDALVCQYKIERKP